MADVGRPSTYTPELGLKICEQLAAGLPLVKIVRLLDVGMSSVYRWQEEHPEFRQAYARAREDQADTLADEILEVADNSEIPSDDRRIRVDTRKWIASKLKPKKYAERQQVEHSGSVGTIPTDPEALTTQLVTLATQYPTLNPVIRKLAEDVLARVPVLG